MNIALMRSRIIIQKNTVTVDEIGNHVNTWTDFYECYAYANMSSNLSASGEKQEAGQIVATDTFTFTVRYCKALAGMTSDGYRILFGGNIYNITKVDDYQFRHETLKIKAERVQRS